MRQRREIYWFKRMLSIKVTLVKKRFNAEYTL